MGRGALLLVAIAMAAGCGDDQLEDFPPALPCEPAAELAEDATRTVSFAADHMLCVRATIDDADFERLRRESRFGKYTLGNGFAWALSNCDKNLPPGYNWYSADVDIDGATLQTVGIRKKGFIGSLSEAKPSLKLKTDRLKKGQRLGDTERVTLNNSAQDATRFITCMAYDVFAAAGHPAPRCNLANVMVNGRAMGPYAHVEAIKKPFLRRVFGNDSGSLYEGTVADFTAGHLAGAADGVLGHWQPKTDDTDPNGKPLLGVLAALETDDASVLASLGATVDIKRFVTFWAVEALVGHTDSYTGGSNNFFVYFDPANQGRAVFIPWGADNVFNADGGGPGEGAAPLAGHTNGELARRLSRIPQVRMMVEIELLRLLDAVWDEDALLLRVDTFAAQVRTAQDDPAYDATISTLKSWIRGRRAHVERWLRAGMRAGSETSGACSEGPTDNIDAFDFAAAVKDFGFGL